jgi:cobalamin transport system ATP-binding protein
LSVPAHAPASEPAVVVDRAGFGYGGAAVLSDVSLRIERGELVCILGTNGAGKTTLLRLLAGLAAPTYGTVSCLGLDPVATPRRRLARSLCFVPQSYELSVPFSVGEIVLMGRYPHRDGWFGLETAADIDAARDAMKRCDVAALEGRRFDAVSGGEQRRALLAQALCQATPLLLLDEPTSSLDPFHAIAVFEALAAECASRAATVVVVTHDLNLAARHAARVVVIGGRGPGEGARIVADGPPAEALAHPETAAAFGVRLHADHVPGTGVRFAVPY